MYFCFERFDSDSCAGALRGRVSTPSECCFLSDRGGLGGGSYVAAGDEQCINCMTVTGEIEATVHSIFVLL